MHERRAGVYIPSPRNVDDTAQRNADEVLNILEARYNEQHFLARRDDTLFGHFIYELRNFRLTGRSLLHDIFHLPTQVQTYPVYHHCFDKQSAQQVVPYCAAEAESLSYYRFSHPCFQGPAKVAVHYFGSTVLTTPVWDRENPRKEDLWGLEKTIFGDALTYGLAGSIVCGFVGGGLGLFLRGLTGIPLEVWALTGAIAGGALGGLSNLLLYSAEILYELGSALKNAIAKKFSPLFKSSAEYRANEILLPIHTSSLGIWEKTENLGAIIDGSHRASLEFRSEHPSVLSLERLADFSFPSRISRKETLIQRYSLVEKLLQDNRDYLLSDDYYLDRFAGFGSPPHTQWQSALACFRASWRLFRSLFSRTDRPIYKEGEVTIQESGTDVLYWGIFPTIFFAAGGVIMLTLPIVELFNLCAGKKEKVRLAFNHFAGKVALHSGERKDREARFDEVSALISRRIALLEQKK